MNSTALAQSFESPSVDRLSALLDEAVSDEVFPGAVLVVSKGGQEIFKKAVGFKTAEEKDEAPRSPMSVETVFDIASLTTVVATTTILMKLFEAGKFRLEDMICRYLQGFSTHGKSPITFAHLLSHSAGFEAWLPFYETLLRENEAARIGIITSRGARDFVINTIVRSELSYEPGSKQVFSDVGFILLGNLIEILTGSSLDKAAQQYLLQPLQLRSTSFVDLSMIKRRGIHPVRDVIAPTEYCEWRKRVLWGEAHDDNAWAMGGIAGHSGLFSNAVDLKRFADEIISAYAGESSYLSRATVHKFFTGLDRGEGELWRFGWDSPSKDNSMEGAELSSNAVGCSGFTGCSLWIEPTERISIILMSNRVHPTRNNKKIRAFRPQIHAAALEAARAF